MLSAVSWFQLWMSPEPDSPDDLHPIVNPRLLCKITRRPLSSVTNSLTTKLWECESLAPSCLRSQIAPSPVTRPRLSGRSSTWSSMASGCGCHPPPVSLLSACDRLAFRRSRHRLWPDLGISPPNYQGLPECAAGAGPLHRALRYRLVAVRVTNRGRSAVRRLTCPPGEASSASPTWVTCTRAAFSRYPPNPFARAALAHVLSAATADGAGYGSGAVQPEPAGRDDA